MIATENILELIANGQAHVKFTSELTRVNCVVDLKPQSDIYYWLLENKETIIKNSNHFVQEFYKGILLLDLSFSETNKHPINQTFVTYDLETIYQTVYQIANDLTYTDKLQNSQITDIITFIFMEICKNQDRWQSIPVLIYTDTWIYVLVLNW